MSPWHALTSALVTRCPVPATNGLLAANVATCHLRYRDGNYNVPASPLSVPGGLTCSSSSVDVGKIGVISQQGPDSTTYLPGGRLEDLGYVSPLYSHEPDC